MKKHPLRLLGIIFAGIAAVELTVLLVLLITLADNTAVLLSAGSVLGLQTLIFGTIGLCFLYFVRKQEKLREDMLSSGYPELAEVLDVERVASVRVNSRHPYRVICRINREGVLHEYRSHMLMEHPGLKTGDPVTVYTDRQNDKHYWVDVESAMPPVDRH